MEIECGEYVRTKEGYIAKLIEKDEDFKFYEFDNTVRKSYGDKLCYMNKDELEEYIVKHSEEIIDLIEVGDYVNGNEVKQIAMFEGFPDYPKLIFTDEKYLIPGETIENKDIKTIVTHEQMQSIEYKVEEDK